MKHSVQLVTLFLLVYIASPASAWNDATHMAVMKAAGLGDHAYLAVGADMAKVKAGGHEEGNHYYNNSKGAVVTADMVLDQVRDYNCRCGGKGHLYGAIVAALNQYLEEKLDEKYAWYPLGYAAHYIGDLSQPMHNIDYDDFNKANHFANDAIVEQGGGESTNAKVARIASGIQQKMKSLPPYKLPSARKDLQKFNLELARKVAEIANKALALGFSMHDATPPRPLMTQDEAYRQLAESAALLKAAYAALQ